VTPPALRSELSEIYWGEEGANGEEGGRRQWRVLVMKRGGGDERHDAVAVAPPYHR
jgi:hypothetical protein